MNAINTNNFTNPVHTSEPISAAKPDITKGRAVLLAPDRCTKYLEPVVGPTPEELADWCHPPRSRGTITMTDIAPRDAAVVR